MPQTPESRRSFVQKLPRRTALAAIFVEEMLVADILQSSDRSNQQTPSTPGRELKSLISEPNPADTTPAEIQDFLKDYLFVNWRKDLPSDYKVGLSYKETPRRAKVFPTVGLRTRELPDRFSQISGAGLPYGNEVEFHTMVYVEVPNTPSGYTSEWWALLPSQYGINRFAIAIEVLWENLYPQRFEQYMIDLAAEPVLFGADHYFELDSSARLKKVEPKRV